MNVRAKPDMQHVKREKGFVCKHVVKEEPTPPSFVIDIYVQENNFEDIYILDEVHKLADRHSIKKNYILNTIELN